MVVHASALDHQGIIHALAETARRHGANILELEATSESAPMSGEPLFRLRMSVRLQEEAMDGESLWRELERVAAEQGATLELHPSPLQDDVPVMHGPERRTRPRGPG
jgi:glycine cleavage system regulatory protein